VSGRFLRLFAIGLILASFAFSADAGTRKHAPDLTGEAFRAFVVSLWPAAEAIGVARETFDEAFKGVTFDRTVVAMAKNQPEFSLPIWRYLELSVSPTRVERGRQAAAGAKLWLDKAQATYEVDSDAIMGIWGIETEFGAFRGERSTIRSLASLAFARFRDDYFREELLVALEILQAGYVAPEALKGSWAGAMGQTQFMPSSFMTYAVDFEGNGRRDIWKSEGDSIGSIACYLAAHGWTPGLPWGFEVLLPEGFALSDADSSKPASIRSFQDRGVQRADKRPFPTTGEARLLILAGLSGPIFLVTRNFDVVKSYNPSTSYALAVGLLGDAIVNHSELATRWPSKSPLLPAAQVKRLQTKLKDLGYDVGEIDGKAGDAFRSAVRAYQEKSGLPPDGYADAMVFRRLSAER